MVIHLLYNRIIRVAVENFGKTVIMLYFFMIINDTLFLSNKY